jgi:flagellar biosynthetic protein FliO
MNMRRKNHQEFWLMLKQTYRNIKLKCLVMTAILGVAFPICHGQTEANSPTGLEKENTLRFFDDPNSLRTDPSPITIELLFRMLGGLLVVIALMVAVLYLSKRVLPKLSKSAGKEIKIIETTMLGPRKYLHVIKIANQRLLLGSTNDRINMLAHLVDDLASLDIEQHDEKEET